MFTKFKKRYQSLFLDHETVVPHADDKFNIILSPSLYWVKKVSLPLQNVRDVKKLLPSLFEEILPNGNYSYSAYKKSDDFFIFAYEDKKILDLLSQKNISLSNVASVHFAQSEFDTIEGAIKINASQSIYVKEEIVVIVPSLWVQDISKLNFRDIQLSKHSITLQQFGHVVDSKSLFKIGTVLLVLISLITAEYFITSYKISEMTQLKDELFSKYNLKSTMMQNSAILKKYDTLYTNQIKLRETLALLLALKLTPSQELTKVNFKNNTLQADFSGIAEGTETNILKTLQEQNINFKSFFKDKSWHVEISL